MTKLRELAEARAEYRAAWAACCEHDGIDAGAVFVAFSADNPHTAELNRRAMRVQELTREVEGMDRRGELLHLER